MMILMSFLVATTLTTLAQSTPLSYSAYQRREPDDGSHDVYVPYLIDEREGSINDVYWPQLPEEENVKILNSSMANNIRRLKRIRSLSVTNSLDVLRDRVLLELARRKAHQDQQQIDANRRILNNIGKRSMRNFAMNLPHHLKMKNERMFGNQLIENPERNELTFRSHPDESIDWYNPNDVADIYEKDNQLQQMTTDELGVL